MFYLLEDLLWPWFAACAYYHVTHAISIWTGSSSTLDHHTQYNPPVHQVCLLPGSRSCRVYSVTGGHRTCWPPHCGRMWWTVDAPFCKLCCLKQVRMLVSNYWMQTRSVVVIFLLLNIQLIFYLQRNKTNITTLFFEFILLQSALFLHIFYH